MASKSVTRSTVSAVTPFVPAGNSAGGDDTPDVLRKTVLKKPPEERMAFVRTIVVPIPQYTRAIELLEFFMTQAGTDDPGGVRICGDSGLGKSVIAESFTKKYRADLTQGQEQLPVLTVRLDAALSAHDVVCHLLRVLGYPFHTNERTTDLFLRAAEGMQRRHVKILLFDEAQELVEGRGGQRLLELGNHLKRLHDHSKVPQAYLGTPTLDKLFSIADQLAGRITATHYLAPLIMDSVYLGLLAAYDQALPLAERSGLAEHYAKPLLTAAGGNLRALRRLLAHAVFLAACDEKPTIDSSYLAKAHFRVFGTASNPFS